MIDTHCHIHIKDYGLDAKQELQAAQAAGVRQLICIGEGIEDCRRAIEFAETHLVYSAVGVHPHNADTMSDELEEIEVLAKTSKRVVAVGECGLDYFYMHSPKNMQLELFDRHFAMAKRLNLPMIFHLRGSREDPNDVFKDFFKLFDQYKPEGVVHSFSATTQQLEPLLQRGLYIGLNGIMTFSKDQAQLDAARAVPTDRLLLETDAPFLTPAPYRGQVNSPKLLIEIAKFIAELKGQSLEQLVEATSHNSRKLFPRLANR